MLKTSVLWAVAITSFVNIKSYGSIYPGNSAFGIFVAIAVPLNLPHRNVFVSYNFEANYNLPGDAQTIIPGVYQRFTPIEEMTPTLEEISQTDTQVVEEEQARDSLATDKASKALITRRSIYEMLSNKLATPESGKGTCLLKLVCEVNASLLGKNNGVFGSILHVLLTPSTSTFEDLPMDMYEAEENGVQGNCVQYEKGCEHYSLDLISVPVEDFLSNK